MIIWFPYGIESLPLNVPEDKVFVVESRIPEGVDEKEAIELVAKALDNPIGTDRVEDIIAKHGVKTLTLLVTDKTRATPNKLLLRVLLPRILRAEDITIIVATGLHKPHNRYELVELLGDDIVNSYTVLSHNSDDVDNHIYLGKTSYGTEVYINKIVYLSDLVIGLGLIEPHFFAGYSGGRKIILPGVSSTKTVYQNHSYKMISHDKADYGVLDGNPVHEDMVEASSMVKNYRFILHVILDKKKKVVDVVAGDPYKAHIDGVRRYDSFARVSVPFQGDLVITTNGGYPLDRDLYQAVKGMCTASRVAKPGGVIVMLAECRDGVGHEHFRDLASMDRDPKKILDYIARNEPLRDQWEVQKLAQVLLKNNVVVVTKNIKHSVLEEMNLIPASSPEEALDIASKLIKYEKIIAIPEGPYVIPEYKA
ncbi:MAG: nickel-dependent lactate racemase [Ignisphaera sp.]|uniref:Nickel-dependent lactate racemase n=1 Tax=Ignisphaera aggregans TaxID=334771 RepID=A0A7C4JK92_9CREN